MMFIGSNIQMSFDKNSGGIFKHKTCTKRRKVCIENMVIVLHNNCATKIMRTVLIVLTSITSFTYNNIHSIYTMVLRFKGKMFIKIQY